MRTDTSFHPGDTVVIRDWDDMAEEYGIDTSNDSIDCRFNFIEEMRRFCGTTVKIKDVTDRGRVWFESHSNGMDLYSWSTDMIAKVDDLTSANQPDVDVDALIRMVV